MDALAPTSTITAVSPRPRHSFPTRRSSDLSEVVSGFDLADLKLARNGGSNLLTGTQTLTTTDNITWTLGGLTGLTGTSGTYVLTLTATGSGIADSVGNALSNSPTSTFVVDATAPTPTTTALAPRP